MYTNYITVLYRAKHELHGKIWEKIDNVLCFGKPLLLSLFQTSQDTLNLGGSSHLTNDWPQGKFGSSPVCSPLCRAPAGLVSQTVVTLNPLVLISCFSQDEQQLFLLSNIITLKVITGNWGKPPSFFSPRMSYFFQNTWMAPDKPLGLAMLFAASVKAVNPSQLHSTRARVGCRPGSSHSLFVAALWTQQGKSTHNHHSLYYRIL